MQSIRTAISTVRHASPILYWIVIIHFVGAFFCIPGLFIDERELMGVNIWLKPLKFFISTGIYIFTVGFLITLYPYSDLKKHIIRNIVSWTLLFEMAIIVIQAARGVQSHYNMSSAFDGVLFGAMGVLIGINVLVMILFAFDTIRLKLLTAKAIQWAIFLGWLITIFASWVGGQMIGQMAHNVGVLDGGEGLPLLNWSTTGGDLRVAHFFGLHSLQLMPLFAYLLYKNWNGKQNYHIIIITLFAIIYASFIFYTFYQASVAIPFISFN